MNFNGNDFALEALDNGAIASVVMTKVYQINLIIFTMWRMH